MWVRRLQSFDSSSPDVLQLCTIICDAFRPGHNSLSQNMIAPNKTTTLIFDARVNFNQNMTLRCAVNTHKPERTL